MIKLIAMGTMFCDHLGYVIKPAYTYMNVIGRIAFILFAFQIALGYRKTKDISKYFFRLIIFAVIAQIPYHLYLQTIGFPINLNIIFTLFSGLLTILVWDMDVYKDKKVIKVAVGNSDKKLSKKGKDKKYKGLTFPEFCGVWIFKIALIATVLILSNIAKMDYGILGILTILGIHIFYPFDKKERAYKIPLYVFLVFAFGMLDNMELFKNIPIEMSIFTVLAVVLSGLITLLYNGKKGPNIKWVGYLFYPLHLLLLVGLSFII